MISVKFSNTTTLRHMLFHPFLTARLVNQKPTFDLRSWNQGLANLVAQCFATWLKKKKHDPNCWGVVFCPSTAGKKGLFGGKHRENLAFETTLSHEQLKTN